MGIIRKDYILDRWVYYATQRGKRPHEFKKSEEKQESKVCFFCPANEHLTPPEIGRIEHKGSWRMRWFPNKFPAVNKEGTQRLKRKKFMEELGSYGFHDIIVETPHHKSQLADLPAQQIAELLEVCKLRIRDLSKIKGIKYVDVFKNHGRDAGTSLVHSHTQVMALPHVPSLVREKVQAAKKHKKCPYCSIIRLESKSKRNIFETKDVVAFAPFASRFNYEAWIFTKKHRKGMEELDENELGGIASALKRILGKLKEMGASYNFFIHYAPSGEDLHFHIEVAPRMATWGGFEISTDAIINSVLPEDAAEFYRE